MKVGLPTRPGAPASPLAAFTGRTMLGQMLASTSQGQVIRLEVKRKDGGKTDTITAKLAAFNESLPDTLPAESTLERGAAEKPAPKPDEAVKNGPETGLLKRQNATLGREYWLYVPGNYKAQVSHGLIIWLHPLGQAGKDADRMVEIWKLFCAEQHYIMVGPKAQSNDGWVASETEGIVQDVKDVMAGYTIDRNRVIAHGMGVGGQMAFYLGFNARDLIRGVATTGAALGTPPKENLPTQPLSFFLVGGEKDPAIQEIAETKPALVEKRFPVIYRPIAEFGKEYMDQKTLIEMCLWLDSLDRI